MYTYVYIHKFILQGVIWNILRDPIPIFYYDAGERYTYIYTYILLSFITTLVSRPLSSHVHQKHTATHCNTLQRTATHCNTLQHTATHRNTLQHTATHCNMSHTHQQSSKKADQIHHNLLLPRNTLYL